MATQLNTRGLGVVVPVDRSPAEAIESAAMIGLSIEETASLLNLSPDAFRAVLSADPTLSRAWNHDVVFGMALVKHGLFTRAKSGDHEAARLWLEMTHQTT